MRLVVDKGLIKEFYREVINNSSFLAGKGFDDVGLVFLASRKKYYPQLVQPYITSGEVLRREIVHFENENEFIKKIKRLDLDEECFTVRLKHPDGRAVKSIDELPENVREFVEKYEPRIETCYEKTYRTKCLVMNIPKETMAIYISLSLHNTVKAGMDFVSALNRLIYQLIRVDNEFEYVASDPNEVIRKRGEILKNFTRNHIKYLSELHKASKNSFVLVDIDSQDEEVLINTLQIIKENTGSSPVWITRTHGGYHLIFDPYSELLKFLFRDLKKKVESIGFQSDVIEIKKKAMTPVPGTLQGNFLVRRYKL